VRRSTLNAQYEASCAERAELVARQQQVQEQGAAVAEEVRASALIVNHRLPPPSAPRLCLLGSDCRAVGHGFCMR
jgi:hypothetical protein